MEWSAWEFTAWVWSAGGEMVKKKEDKYWRITFNEAPGIDAVMLWHDEDSFMAQAQIKADNNSLQPAPPNNMNLTEKYDALVKK